MLDVGSSKPEAKKILKKGDLVSYPFRAGHFYSRQHRRYFLSFIAIVKSILQAEIYEPCYAHSRSISDSGIGALNNVPRNWSIRHQPLLQLIFAIFVLFGILATNRLRV
jgi:hypothetical protein